MKGFSFALFLLFTVAAQQVFAQQQQQTTVPVPSDTIEPPPTQQELANKKIMNRQPNKAALMSAILPGAGQVYNKKYWKAPLPPIGLLITGYLAIDYSNKTKVYGEAASLAEHNADRSALSTSYTNAGYNLQTLSATQLRTLQDDSRRYMYMNIVIFSGIYALNIVDAYVDAHLKEFDVNENLSFKVKPLFYATNYSHLATGLTLSIRLK
ncbi:DUF5683 domain-containing protein [Cytophaga hutchinsonii]|jgi:hypothetical protein|uniref:DUF5683 domain-containing protein n=1 Tax=Cytophaga hutchinsonii (strain ATCC 33406 / DSM 1761 / CIP 103989 / NBRC 15051 / NCIMB 9469 / D465) TaxID=269798 RepID=A0A6N4STW1_CYTH3|nr:DUF5683 domain-containing protein [Cytophaga hutchinsonii]ABG59815.1 conserved hypothetical protein [Cytophaga hutchinsonii ATCC 33406]SFX29353.1 hypothetical protein SAMN04487930_102489 [Cytophaga hutchinsonii ATCC 33406]